MMTPEQKEALCEYVDGQREAHRSYHAIAEQLSGHYPEQVLGVLEIWHRTWKKTEWRKKARLLSRETELGDTDAAEPEPAPPALPENVGGRGDTVRYLAQKLISPEVIKTGKVRWRPHYTRALQPGQTCERRKGPGQAGAVRWLVCAVIFRTGDRIDHVEAEARIRARHTPESKVGIKNGWKREMIRVEKLELVAEKLDLREIGAQQAALLQTYLGKGSGIKSGAHLGRLTDRTRQAVSARKGLIVEDYYEKTGGKAGFEGVTSAERRRDKVRQKITETDARERIPTTTNNPCSTPCQKN